MLHPEIAVADAALLSPLSAWFDHIPVDESCGDDLGDDQDTVRMWQHCSEVGDIARGYVARGGDPRRVVAVLLEALREEEGDQLLDWAAALQAGSLDVRGTQGAFVRSMLRRIVDEALEPEPRTAMVLGYAASVAFGSPSSADDAFVIVRDLLTCGAYGCTDDGRELTARGEFLRRGLVALHEGFSN